MGPNCVKTDLDDYDGIMVAVQAYMDASNDRDFKKSKRAFHEDAWMFGIDEAGAFFEGPLDDRELEQALHHYGGHEYNAALRVLSVHQMGGKHLVRHRRGRHSRR
jgi:ketosteroid isomerase-like protein